tara:strand:+ start:10483 stop:10917 length:435 start_codon:yes stop_codon:yes gene_type:complete
MPNNSRQSQRRQRTSRRRQHRQRTSRRNQRRQSQNINIENIKNYFNNIMGEHTDFNLDYYKSRMNSLVELVKNLYTDRSLAQIETQMRGRYMFRRNDINEAAKLYREMNNHPKYKEHERQGMTESTPTLSHSRSRSRRRSNSRS